MARHQHRDNNRCKYCGGTGIRIYADVENGPEFDSEGPCDCPAGDRLVEESNKAGWHPEPDPLD